MKKFFRLIYGVLSYTIFLGTYTYLVAFLANWGVPKTIDSGSIIEPWTAGVINFLLITLFAVQHSVMARKGFKQWLNRFISGEIERSTYVLVSSLMFIIIFIFWRPMPEVIWSTNTGIVRTALLTLMISGFAFAVVSSFMINHFELFGLQQVYNAFFNKEITPLSFRTPLAYKLVRHPIQLGQMIGVLVTPDLTVGHLIFGAGMALYIFIGIYFEERDLMRRFGEQYAAYRESVPQILPAPNPPKTYMKHTIYLP
ncbi:MAG: isoprenylcysteine carboxylmethyltransferase family protein [Candidatus Marinimicrobia bacterium]|nr:isoprenylcysteine carboxylmethyltransferase family protein [Candidatus Neomarinimicrobiota bacterium]